MDITKRIKNALAAFTKTENSVSVDGNAFLRYGARNRMPSTWSRPDINDEDFYSGYGYAVINKRANRAVVLGKKFLFTEAKESIVERANEQNQQVVHPYLTLIRDSDEFTQRDFWYDISTYLDLEGVYYLMAVRTVTRGVRVGAVQKFTLLNPYWVRPIVNEKGELGGYVENNPHKGNRDIPKEMIIPIRLLNPFDPEKPWSLADAARDSQFVLKQANDFSREAINGNLNSPGILSSAIELPEDQFENFVNRVKNHGRGEPLFGNGAGTIAWTDMQTDLDKAALDKLNSINRDTLLAISGLSKTGVGVEESGTGREVSRTQKDDFTENAVMPQIENIIDALNLDYRKYYPAEYKTNGYNITLDNPLETNRDAEQADVDIRESQFDLMQSLVSKGYSIEIASKYAKGLIDLTALGEPTEIEEPVEEEPVVPPAEEPPVEEEPTVEPENDYKDKTFDVYEGYPIPVLQYLSENASQLNALSEEGSTIYSNESMLTLNAASKTVRIKTIAEMGDSLIAVVDDTTYIRLGEFKQNADRIAIISKLNKRYTNQPVAIKKKINLNHDCTHDVFEKINNAFFDSQEQINTNTANLLLSAAASEQQLYAWYLNQLAEGNPNPHPTELEEFINSLTLPFAVYFTVMFPIYASHRVQQTANDLNITDEVPMVAMTEEVKRVISDFARKEATSHVNTIRTDIENALAKVRAQTSDPQEMRVLLDQAFADIQRHRAPAIASNAAARIYNVSSYEADLQFLTRVGMVEQAYKVLFSLSGDPCGFCSSLINAGPVPFRSSFADIGDTLRADGREMRLDYETITAGNIHPNCHCAYKLVIQD